MDLSQQELPLTAYFTRSHKETKSRAVPSKKGQSITDTPLLARPSKRRKRNVQSASTSSPSGSSASQPKSRMRTPQLPTPVTSIRKRVRGGRLQPPAKTLPMSTGTSLSSVEQNAILVDEAPESEPFPTSMSQLSQADVDGILGPLATPSIAQRHTGIATPQTLPRRIPQPTVNVDSPLAFSNCRLPSMSSEAPSGLQATGVSCALLPHGQYPTRSTTALLCSLVPSRSPDSFFARGENGVSAQRDGAFAPLKQPSVQSKLLDSQSSGGHAIPTLPVPSSQSQYLLHLDATPKRKRCSLHMERVVSSQTQEERELTLSTPHRPAIARLSVEGSAGKYPGANLQIFRLSDNEQKSQRAFARGRTLVGSPTTPTRSPFAARKTSDELPHKSPSPSRRETMPSCHSPSCKAKTPRRPPGYDPIENIPYVEESLTESESESDILQLKMRCKLSALDPPSRELDHVPRHSPLVRCGSVECNFPGVEDDSTTEAESDTEILHCVAAIGNKRSRDHRFEVSRKDTPPRPIISPLVSPTRPRIAPAPPSPIAGSIQFFTQEGGGSSPPWSCPPCASAVERPQISPESLPSAVREFVRMFPGDESYPADFPESLRV